MQRDFDSQWSVHVSPASGWGGYRSQVCRVGMLIGAVWLTAAAGCSSYHAKPLLPAAVNHELQHKSQEFLTISSSRFHGNAPATQRLSPRRGLSPAEAATIAVLLNPSLQALRDQHGVAAAQLMQAGLLPNPQLAATGDFVTGGYRTGTFNAYGLSLSWDLTSLIDRNARIAAARYHQGQVDLQVAWQEWQAAEAARLAVYNLAAVRSEIAQANKIRTQLHRNYEAMRQAYGRRLITIVDLAAARSALQQADSVCLQLRQSRRQGNNGLTTALGIPAGTPIALRTHIRLPSKLNLPSAATFMHGLQQRRLDLVALRMGYKSQDAFLRAAVLRQFPNISIGFQQASDTTNVHTDGFGVTLSLPIFDHNQAKIAEARQTRRQLYDDYIARVFAAKSQAALLLANIRSLEQRIAAEEAASRGLSELVATYRKALGFGNADIINYYTLVKRLYSRRIAVIKLKDQLIQNDIALQLATGLYMPVTGVAPHMSLQPVGRPLRSAGSLKQGGSHE